MKAINILMIIAGIAMTLAVVNLIVHFEDIKSLTGFATDTGTANLTIESASSVSFVTSVINWGTGYVDETPTSAHLDTEGNVIDGTGWNTISNGLALQNDGNVNVTLNLSASNNAADFIGGTGPWYRWKVSNNESDSCVETINISSYTNVTTVHQVTCINFGFDGNRNLLNIDINITVPEDATVEAKGSVITATATALS